MSMIANLAIPLHSLLRYSLPGTVRWLRNEPSATLKASWVTISPDEVQPDDLLIIHSNDPRRELYQQAAQRGAAAILLIGETEPVLDASSAIPVAWIAGLGDLRQVQQSLLAVLLNQRAALVERGVRIHTQLSQLAAGGGGLEGIVRVMADISGRSVVVQDKRLNILAECPASMLAGIWDDIIAQVREADLLPPSLHDRKQAGKDGGLVEQALPGGLARLVAPIVVGQVARGYLSMLGIKGELDSLDQLVLEQGVLVCALEMARAKAVRETQKRLHGDLLTALLQESLSPRDARLWVEAMGLDPDQSYIAVRFAWDATQPPSLRRLETLVNGEIARAGLHAILTQMGEEIICFCRVPADPVRPELALKVAQLIVDQARQDFPQTVLRCGMGSPAVDLSAWRLSFRQSGQALELARRFGENRPLYYPDLSVYRLLLQLEHSPELLALRQEILGPLLEHEGGDEFLHTLEIYFAHNGNLSQTAEALFLHRNTLVYRMDRIAEITHLDLTQPETRLALQLALHIQRMLKK
jgi:purine catabolism regulator